MNSLSSGISELSKNEIAEAIEKCGHRPDVRGEKLSTEDFCKLSDVIYEIINQKK